MNGPGTTKQAFSRGVNWALFQLAGINIKHIKWQIAGRWDKVKDKYAPERQQVIQAELLKANHHLDEADRHIQLAIKQFQLINQIKAPKNANHIQPQRSDNQRN